MNLYLGILALAVILLGLRQIVWMQEEDWKVRSATWTTAAEQRLQVAEQWEAYWHQQASAEAATPKFR